MESKKNIVCGKDNCALEVQKNLVGDRTHLENCDFYKNAKRYGKSKSMAVPVK
jgi:hypothetical protein